MAHLISTSTYLFIDTNWESSFLCGLVLISGPFEKDKTLALGVFIVQMAKETHKKGHNTVVVTLIKVTESHGVLLWLCLVMTLRMREGFLEEDTPELYVEGLKDGKTQSRKCNGPMWLRSHWGLGLVALYDRHVLNRGGLGC